MQAIISTRQINIEIKTGIVERLNIQMQQLEKPTLCGCHQQVALQLQCLIQCRYSIQWHPKMCHLKTVCNSIKHYFHKLNHDKSIWLLVIRYAIPNSSDHFKQGIFKIELIKSSLYQANMYCIHDLSSLNCRKLS